MKKIGIVFSKPKDFGDPLEPMGVKRPVYEELASKCKESGLELFVVSAKGYKGLGKFDWYYEITKGKTHLIDEPIVLDLAFDRSGGLRFPVEEDKFRVVDNLEFKKFAWDKWQAYQLLKDYMPATFWVGDKNNLEEVLSKVKTDWVVLKPVRGLKGIGIYIGPKSGAYDFVLLEKKDYLAQEFVDTSKGITGITDGTHDLRVVVINGKIVWSHVRTPVKGEYKSNVARGGSLNEVDVKTLPQKVINITQKVSNMLYNRFDNPIYSVDFGIDSNGEAYVFEINDQMGFPKPEMKAKDLFLSETIGNFKSKL